jgi:hypothetical protein
MGCLSAVMPKGIGSINPREWLAVVGLPSEAERTPKAGAITELLHSGASIIDKMLQRAVEQRTSQEFKAVREEVFPEYFRAMIALGGLIRVAISSNDMVRLKAESFSELEAQFRERGAASFGADLRDRGLFTVWTLRKINDLAENMEKLPVTDPVRDFEVAKQFAVSALWSRFHIDCLVKSMTSGKALFPEVAEEMVDGLRAAVNAYAAIREALELRTDIAEPELAPIQWEPEDEDSLADSMRDIGLEC